jgi:hypothetical protein
MSQNQSSKFRLPFYYPFGSLLLFLPVKPQILPAIWLLAGCYFKPCDRSKNSSKAKNNVIRLERHNFSAIKVFFFLNFYQFKYGVSSHGITCIRMPQLYFGPIEILLQQDSSVLFSFKVNKNKNKKSAPNA